MKRILILWCAVLISTVGLAQGVLAAAPVFLVPSNGVVVAGSVAESIAPGSAILTLVAQDADADILTMSIKSQTPSSPAFSYDSATDEVRVPAGGLDCETAQIFVFVFSVSDSTTTVDSVQFHLNVTDVDEYNPVFSPATYTGSATDGDTIGTPMFTVTATDQDVTADITYSITAGNTPDTFTINGTTGEVTIGNTANVDSSRTPSYTLTITASGGSLSTTVQATITVYGIPVTTTNQPGTTTATPETTTTQTKTTTSTCETITTPTGTSTSTSETKCTTTGQPVTETTCTCTSVTKTTTPSP